MPIQFACPECRQRLSIGSRKAGTEILCPKCKAPTLVPQQSEPADGSAVSSMSAGESCAELSPDIVSPAEKEQPPEWPVKPVNAEVHAPASPHQPIASEFPGMVLVKRRVIYIQAILIVLVGLLAFSAGYVIGGAGNGIPLSQPVGTLD